MMSNDSVEDHSHDIVLTCAFESPVGSGHFQVLCKESSTLLFSGSKSDVREVFHAIIRLEAHPWLLPLDEEVVSKEMGVVLACRPAAGTEIWTVYLHGDNLVRLANVKGVHCGFFIYGDVKKGIAHDIIPYRCTHFRDTLERIIKPGRHQYIYT
jgi:hypothetical protein